MVAGRKKIRRKTGEKGGTNVVLVQNDHTENPGTRNERKRRRNTSTDTGGGGRCTTEILGMGSFRGPATKKEDGR